MKFTKELRGMARDDLADRLKESKKELLKLRVQASTGTTAANPGKLKQTKKNIARILTILNEEVPAKPNG